MAHGILVVRLDEIRVWSEFLLCAVWIGKLPMESRWSDCMKSEDGQSLCRALYEQLMAYGI